MKKYILIYIILINATYAYAFDISVHVSDDLLFDHVRAENITGEKVIDENERDKDIIEDNKEEENIKEEDIREEVTQKEKEKEEEKVELKTVTEKNDTLSDKVSEINSIQSDEEKVKEWAKFKSAENYVIINKKKCSASVYDKSGIEMANFEVGIGKEIGDDFNDTLGLLGKSKNTTPAGEYTLIPNIYNKSAYGDVTLSLGNKANKAKKSKKMVALHKVPKFREKDRLKKFYDGNLANNRMSHGCINFIEEDFKELTKYIHAGFKVYVLPEESNNSLILTKNSKNEFEFTQTKY